MLIKRPAPRAPPTETKISFFDATAVDTMSEAPFPNANNVAPYLLIIIKNTAKFSDKFKELEILVRPSATDFVVLIKLMRKTNKITYQKFM